MVVQLRAGMRKKYSIPATCCATGDVCCSVSPSPSVSLPSSLSFSLSPSPSLSLSPSLSPSLSLSLSNRTPIPRSTARTSCAPAAARCPPLQQFLMSEVPLYPANCRPILGQMPPYPVPNAALSDANCRPILCQPPPYPVPTAALSCARCPLAPHDSAPHAPPYFFLRKHGLSTEPVPVSAYVGSSKNLKDLKDLTPPPLPVMHALPDGVAHASRRRG